MELSVDDRLLFEQNQSTTFHPLKPIGAERKIGQISSKSIDDQLVLSNQHQSMFSSDDYWTSFHVSNESIDELHSNLFSSTNHNCISSSIPIDLYQYQSKDSSCLPLTSSNGNASLRGSSNSSSRSSQTVGRVPWAMIRPSTRSFFPVTTIPRFSAPFACPRERFQVNSIGRPIFRSSTAHHSSHIYGCSSRR